MELHNIIEQLMNEKDDKENLLKLYEKYKDIKLLTVCIKISTKEYWCQCGIFTSFIWAEKQRRKLIKLCRRKNINIEWTDIRILHGLIDANDINMINIEDNFVDPNYFN